MDDNHSGNTTSNIRTGTGKCPVMHGARTQLADRGTSNRDWWPNQLNLDILHQHAPGPTRWARTSTTPRRSRPSTWRR